ncbi:MAG: 2-phospho-L-lactate transferase [Rhizobiaceae bacterium]|nr:2-phospho-L-lactate transferase [Rhizobiaceae bacterium]
MAEGLARALPSGSLTVIANVGDDEEFYGLRVCPDIDTLLYTLSDRIDRGQGWGVGGDTVKALDVLRDLGAPTWMKLGDADFGLHIWRSWRLREGDSLSAITAEATKRFGAAAKILPATDDRLRTRLDTDEGWMDFQPWFVGRHCKPKVKELRFDGAGDARPGAPALAALAAADLIVIAPSNPLLSIEPILAVSGLREAIASAAAPCIGVSPLIGGKAVKGPLARLMADLGHQVTSAAVARRYGGLVDAFVVDAGDRADAGALEADGLAVLSTDILMNGPPGAERLARELLEFALTLPVQPGRAA